MVGWLLTAISYGLALYCAGGAEWARASCFFLPLWRVFALRSERFDGAGRCYTARAHGSTFRRRSVDDHRQKVDDRR